MSKIVLDSKKIKEDINKTANKAIPRILIVAFLCTLLASCIKLVYKLGMEIFPDGSFINIAVLTLMGIYITFLLFEIIYGLHLVISIKIKARRGCFTVVEDELADRPPCMPARLKFTARVKFRFVRLLTLKDYHLMTNVTFLKTYGKYTITTSEDDGHLRYITGNDKVYVVLVNGVKEPILVYTHMIYDYVE